jgi:hypothetical protein
MKSVLRITICLSLLTIHLFGQTWSALAGGCTGGSPSSVNSMCVYQSLLCVAGNFYDVDKNTKSWDGTAWDNSPAILTGLPAFFPLSIAVYHDSVFVGGTFTWTLNRDGIAKTILNLGWKAVGQGNGMNGGAVYAFAVYNGELYAAGSFGTAGTISANNIARWNGLRWDSVGNGLGGNVYSLAVFNNELYAGGTFGNGIYKWNGTTWSMVGSGVSITGSNGVFALDSCMGKLYVGGQFSTAGGISANNVASWDGSAWSAVGLGTDQKVNALCEYNGQLYSGGYFSVAGSVSANHIASWNGSTWSSLSTGTNDIIYSLCQYNTELVVGGQFTTAGGISANAIAKWYSPSATGIEESHSLHSIKVSPNPTNNILLIDQHGVAATSICIYSMLGEKIYECPFSPSIDVSELPNGIYILKASNKAGHLIDYTRFIKQ